MEIVITNENFESEIIKSDIPAIVDFWATWCGPCRMLAPEIEKIAEKFDGKIKVGKVNVDDCPALADRFGIQFIPTVIAFKNGEKVAETNGYMKADELLSKLGL